MADRAKYLLKAAGVIAAYFVTARLGLQVDPAGGGFATFVWAPTGIALASLLLGGLELWPAITIGAFTANFTTGAKFPVAVGITIGNTMEAVVAAYVLKRYLDFNKFDRIREVLGVIIVSGLFGTMISATIGGAALWSGGVISTEQLPQTWLTWWAGDAMGAIIVAPMLLSWFSQYSIRTSKKQVVELLFFIFGLVVTSGYVFANWADGLHGYIPAFPFFLVPFTLWAALRFGQRGAATSMVFITAVAIWGTYQGYGIFGESPNAYRILFLYFFLAQLALTGMVIAAINNEKSKMTEDLRLAKEVAESANRAKSTFLANMSHEIRTPLGAVIGFSELITDPEVDEEKRGKYFTAIKRNGELLSNIIGDILDYSKVEVGRSEIFLRPVRLADIISDAKFLLGPMAEEKRLTLKITSSEKLPETINTDPIRLRQILLNIAGNAIKFTSHGSVEILVDWAPGNANLIAFIVKDTGPGIREDHKGKLFVPFSQIESGQNRTHGGSGLGLVLSRHFAHLLGGDVTLDNSELGKGSTFAITIDPGAV